MHSNNNSNNCHLNHASNLRLRVPAPTPARIDVCSIAHVALAKHSLACPVVLKQIPQIFEYSFVLQYSNTIYAIQLFICDHVGLHMYIFSTTWSCDAHN